MNDQDLVAELLPRLFRLEDQVLVCGGCRRRWRWEADRAQLEANQDYFYEHALSHTRLHSRYGPRRTSPRSRPTS